MKHSSTTNTSKLNKKSVFNIYHFMSNSVTYKCQMFQLYNFYVLYVLNTRHKLYMKLYMVSELSISFLVFAINTPPPHGHCAGGTHPTGMHSC